MINLCSSIRFHAARTPDRPAIVYDGRTISYAELMTRAEGMAAFLAARDVGRGDVVAVVMKNSAAFIDVSLAAAYLGAVFLPINFRLAAEEIAYITGFSEAKLLLVDEEFASKTEGALPRLLLDGAAQADPRRLGGGEPPAPPVAARDPDALLRLMFTSGTTDRPKGVMHSYANIYWKSMDQAAALGLTAQDRLLVVGPLYHVGAYDLPGIAVLMMGGMLCILRDFDPSATLAAIERHRLTGAWLAPVMLSQLLSLEGRERYELSSLRWVIGGGERTPESRIRAFTDLFHEARYIDAYGLTESCGGDTFMDAGRELEKIGSTGRPVAHVELAIMDDCGRPLPAGVEGEICLRGPKVTKGYLKDPERTAASFFGDWFRTGDVGYVDGEGFLYLTDRKKDMIISGAENIASSEVERVLYEMPAVSEAAVIGLPDERWGERPVAVVVAKPGCSLTFEQVTAFCRGRLAGFKTPRQLVLRESLPRNPSGKILKRVLREELSGLRV